MLFIDDPRFNELFELRAPRTSYHWYNIAASMLARRGFRYEYFIHR